VFVTAPPSGVFELLSFYRYGTLITRTTHTKLTMGMSHF